MSSKIDRRGWLPLVLAVAIKIFSVFPGAVEKVYSTGLYPPVGKVLRLLFGWLPFSIGDLFYIAAGGWILYKLVCFFRKIFLRQAGRSYLFSALRRLLSFVLWVYIVFYLLWGLNYDRKGIADQLSLNVHSYSTQELQDVLGIIVNRLNEADSLARPGRDTLKDTHKLFAGAVDSYKDLAGQMPLFSYSPVSVKSSLFGELGNYLGFGGYYNPFSGEAQVNGTMPVFTLPFTVCHEMGHQLGYARENEANFSGYLAAKSSTKASFRYSVYFELYSYAARELYVRDSGRLKPFREQLRPGVRQDFKELSQFYKKYENHFEPYIRRLYGRYLKANGQPQGIMTYNEVIAWLIAYYEKYGAGAV